MARDQGSGIRDQRIAEWLDPASSPSERPSLDAMSAATRNLHESIDAHAKRTGIPYLHPDEPTVQLDLLGSRQVIEWQEGKAAFLFASEGCWSELPALYARYGTNATAQLITKLKTLEGASAALVCDSGMQATALAFDALMEPGGHAVIMRQVYNKTRSYLEWMAARVGGSVTIVDDGDMGALAVAIRPETRFVFAETFTNPLVRAQNFGALNSVITTARSIAPALRFVLDTTIASPWAFKTPPLDNGVDIVVASGTKSLGGNDRDMWGYIATNDTQFANSVMDLIAMRGGILDWRRAGAIVASFDEAGESHGRRSASASKVAAFLASHPKVSEVFHPSLPNHPDRAAIDTYYARHGSMLSFRIAGADEDRTRHFADVLATTVIVRYALSFDGLATKVNHHRTVSEYFTAPDQLKRNGFDRLIRLAVGLEDADDLIAALNWTLHHGGGVTAADIEQWQRQRAVSLGT
ncbi:MAG TPA: PLP-dependent transferase [Vicinamibacterales bacterium]|nr:PLP-dependent transferase [Vicinamibacterales bacterium]